jgi:tRNA (guanine-N7-)-methyltransferase
VEVELGCAEGQFSFQLAQNAPQRLVVGLDIREPLIRRNRERAAAEGLSNLLFAYVNLNVDLDRVFPEGSVDRFHLLFPDPWFKGKHRKRRAVDQDLAGLLCRQLRPGGELHVASDVFDLALDAMAELEDPRPGALGLRNLAGPWSFAKHSPVEATSTREDTTVGRGQRVWRLRYELREAS